MVSEQQARELSGVETPHARTVSSIAEELAVDVEVGLAPAQAESRLEETGPNRIKEDPGPTRVQLLVRQFRDPLVLVLLVAALISGFLLGDWLEAAVIVAIVIVNAVIGFTQEAKAADAAEGLRRLSSPSAKVLRSGIEQEIPTETIVPGDVVIIESGDRIFADARLIDVSRLQADESELTGESTPVHKSTEAVPVDSVLGDRTSMVFSGTAVAAGRGTGLVTATGAETEIGHIAGMLREDEPATPLEIELAHVGKQLGILAGVVALLVLGFGLVQGRPLESMFLLAVALAVAAIPEGLPAVVGVTLGRGVQTMARHNAIVRRMPAVEALGAVTVICTDKTGTLTRNQIRVQEVRVDDDVVADLEATVPDRRLEMFSSLAVLCSNARTTDNGWKGDPTEIALARAAATVTDPARTMAAWPRIDEFPFESERKRMSTVHSSDEDYLVATKGAPEVILPRCFRVESADGPVGLADTRRSQWLEAAEDMAARGLRTLALAYRNLEYPPANSSEAEKDLVLVALVGMSDEIRPEARPSLDEAKQAGIDVVMITGDHEVTASAIAGELGLLGDREVMSGQALHSADDDELSRRVGHVGVYARVDPADKVRIVKAWQSHGGIVAMTGDGINDAPALRIADVGVGMGSGTDVARDASDIVLADDNFATIVAAVRGGRTIFSNIRKVIAFLLAANVSEVVVVFVGFLIFSSLGDPLLATQILWVNLVTDGLPAVALGFDPPDRRLMRRPPGRRKSLLSRRSQVAIAVRGALLAVIVLAAFGYGVVRDIPWETTRTLGFTTLVFVQLTYVYALRVSESGWKDGLTGNPLLLGAVLASAALQVLVVATPLGNSLFSTAPLSADMWLVSVGLALLAGLVIIAASALLPWLDHEE